MNTTWKQEIEKELSSNYPGTKIKWNGDDPSLLIPDSFRDRIDEIIAYMTTVWSACGGEVVFYPELQQEGE